MIKHIYAIELCTVLYIYIYMYNNPHKVMNVYETCKI